MKIKNKINSIVLILVTFFAVTMFFNKAWAAENSILDEGRKIIKNYYVESVSEDILKGENIQEMVKALNDPYSSYFTKREYSDFVNGINNEFCGIGIRIDVVPEGIKVVSLIEGSPAAQAGLKSGDIIIEADGKAFAGLPSEKVVVYIRGEENTTVKLKIKRGQEILNFDIIRKKISLPTVIGKVLDSHLAYIGVNSFGMDTASEFSKTLSKVKLNNPQGYIIDLRNNPGGYLSTAIQLAGYFIGDKPALKISGRNGKMRTYYAVNMDNKIDKPVVFLINGNSASASEILSAAVKDYKKAFFIGTNTYGKGVAQSMFSLSDGSVLKLTTERFYSPFGKVIHKVGISPDFEVEDEVGDAKQDNVDSLKVAELLIGKFNETIDKNDFTKVSINGWDFEVDGRLAKNIKYKSSYDYIINKANTEGAVVEVPKIIPISDSGAAANGNANSDTDTDKKIIQTKQSDMSDMLLPKTGFFVDFNLLIVAGIAFIGVGVKKL